MHFGPQSWYRCFASQCEADVPADDSEAGTEAALIGGPPERRDPVRHLPAALAGVGLAVVLLVGVRQASAGDAAQGPATKLRATLRLYPKITPCIGPGCPPRRDPPGSPSEGEQPEAASPTPEWMPCTPSSCDCLFNGTVYRRFGCGSLNGGPNRTAHGGSNASSHGLVPNETDCTGAGAGPNCSAAGNGSGCETLARRGTNGTGCGQSIVNDSIAAPDDSNATDGWRNASNAMQGRRCNNTDNWTNGVSDCILNGTGFGNYTGVGCTPAGLTCEAYEANAWCDKEWALGRDRNFPELHCCVCAATFRASPEQMASWVRDFYSAWNERRSDDVAEAFAPDGALKDWHAWIRGGAEVARANQEIFDKMPSISIEVLKVYPTEDDDRGAACVDLLVNMTEGDLNETFKVEEVIEFRNDGRILSMHGAVAKITDLLSDQSKLLVRNLPPNANDLYVYKIFAPFGAIDRAYVRVGPDGTCTGSGLVKFSRASEARRAVSEVSGRTRGDGSTLEVSAVGAGDA